MISKMKGFPQGFFSLFLIFLGGGLFNSVSRCDAQKSTVPKVMYACDDQIMHISCPHRSLSVKILSAKYGRLLSEKNICQPNSDRQVVRDCGENNVKPNVDKLCVGKTECSFDVDDRNLGAFCVNVYKYVTVIFSCVVKPTTKEPPTTTPTTTPLPTTGLTTTTSLEQTMEPNTNLSSTYVTDNSTSNSTSEPDRSNEPIKATQEVIKVSPSPRKPIIEVYERDVFSRRNGAMSTLSSGLHSIICKFALSLLVLLVFDVNIFRVT
ncbi:uncharacterized protein LOC116298987 [Actinia tenebrosa]|uniref:Uncharacterized protein LOC116298987 n=1 Tax=Actinia tenebrosa TaxID=6105 RepID=A0A6P8IDF0_ACTTE|nr:uncharacterized protein LOC116298987 [Actinia tenebrosa]